MSVEQKLMMKLRNCLCLECTRLTLSLSRWLMHSTTYLFLSIILSRISRSLFFMFDFSPWTMCTPLSNISSKSPLEMYPLSANFFPKRFFDSTLYTRLSLFDVGHCKAEGQDFAPVVAEVMQLEPEEPTHRTFTSLCYSLERLVNINSLIPAYPSGSAVNKADACALAQKYLLDEQDQRYGHLFLQFYKTVARNDLGEEMTHMLANLFQIEMLQTTVSRIMKKYQDEHDFRLRQGETTVILALCAGFKRIFCHHCIKKLAEIICHTK